MRSISVLVSAFNEEKYLEEAVVEYDKVLSDLFSDYEILIFDDGSTDSTLSVARNLSKKNPRIKVFHNERNMGLGFVYRRGVNIASKYYFVLLPGESTNLSLKENFVCVGLADMIIPYIGNQSVRPFYRRIVSWCFTFFMNFLFGLNLKYFNGHVIHKVSLLRSVVMSTNSFGYQAEILVQLIKRGCSYKEVPYMVKKDRGGSSCFRVKNLLGVMIVVIKMFFRGVNND